ncbi:MAG: hypothetical protein JXA52_02780 [Planctomycetes bacterium]|nr:hypothetical protein [Planctomycetota bacterium]
MPSFLKNSSLKESRRAKSLFVVIILFLLLVWTVGQVFRDGCWVTALCFYFPSPVAAILLMLGAAFAWYNLGKNYVVLAVVALLAPAFFTIGIENHWTKQTDELEEMAECRLVHWNIMHTNLDTESIIATLNKYKADIYVLSEVSKYVDDTAIAQGLGEEFIKLRLGELSVIAKDRLVSGQRITNGKAKSYPVAWNFGEIEIKLLVVDLPSSIFIERAPLLQWVCDIAIQQEPDLIVGDFNAPRRSLGFSKFPPGYAHAYDLAGKGWGYTWPTLLPVYAIDQCLVGPKITTSDYQIHSTLTSDHCLQVLSFTR